MKSEDLDQHFDGLTRACEAFPPLAVLISRLSNVDCTPGSRDDLGEVSKAVFDFLVATHLPSLGIAVDRLRDLCFALADLDRGKNPPLFKREFPAAGRALFTGAAIGWDYLITAYQYLVNVKNHSRDDAVLELRKDLSKLGCELTPGEIDNRIRHHDNDVTRKSDRPEGRHKIDSDAQYQLLISQVVDLIGK